MKAQGYAANAIGGAGEIVRGHEFHYSDFIPETPAVIWPVVGSRWPRVYRNGLAEAQQTGNTFASYLHIHFAQRSGNVAALAGGGGRRVL